MRNKKFAYCLIFSGKIVDIVCEMQYNIIIRLSKTQTTLNETASVRKENTMNEMTNEQFRTILEMIIQIIKDNDKDIAIKKIEALINKD